MSTVPRPYSGAVALESQGHVAGPQRIGKPMIYPKNPVFIGCFERLPIAGVAKYVEASGDVILGFRWAISSLTKEVIRQMYAKSYVAAMWSDVEEPQQSACLFVRRTPRVETQPSLSAFEPRKPQRCSVGHGRFYRTLRRVKTSARWHPT
jgi:hypothetical protein